LTLDVRDVRFRVFTPEEEMQLSDPPDMEPRIGRCRNPARPD
jgi:hypothetical protein